MVAEQIAGEGGPQVRLWGKGRVRELVGIALWALAVAVVASLATRSWEDWPTSSWSPGDESHNVLGPLGAVLSGALSYVFGWSAYVVAALATGWGWNLFWNRPRAVMLRVTPFVLSACLCACVLFVLAAGREGHAAFSVLGFFGRAMHGALVKWTGHFGVYLFSTAGLVISLILAFDIGLGAWLARLGSLRRGQVLRAERRRKPDAPRRPSKPTPEVPVTVDKRTVVASEMIEFSSPKIVGGSANEGAQLFPLPTASDRGAEVVYVHPSPALLDPPPPASTRQSERELLEAARRLESAIAAFGVDGKVTEINPGPVITRFDVEPGPGVKVGRIASLADDLALVMRVARIRILAPVPGKGAVGVEVPNAKPELVALREIVEAPAFQEVESLLTLAMGKTASGEPYCTDLGQLPHLLIAGATGAGQERLPSRSDHKPAFACHAGTSAAHHDRPQARRADAL